MNRIKSLDGIRAISILMVLLGHASHTMPASLTNNFVFRFMSNGSLGVKFFFVISGYLITRLLIVEEQSTGTINIKHFYVRRVFRIFPVFYLYIFVVLLLKWTLIPNIFSDYHLVVFSGLYLWNYANLLYRSEMTNDNGYWFFGHFWSLSMEEQFYFLWPVTFKKIDKDVLTKLVFAIVLCMPLLRLITYFLMPDSRGQIGMMLHTGADTILTGCLGALLEKKILSDNKIKYIFKNNYLMTFLLAFLFILSPLISERLHGAYSIPIGITLDNFIILLILLWSIYIPSVISKLLNTQLLVHIGVLSYSLYVWQQLLLTDHINFLVNKFPINLILLTLIAIISYNFIEKPILNLKQRFKKRPARNNQPNLDLQQYTQNRS